MLVTDGVLRARYRESFEKESFLEPGKVYELTVDLWSTSLVFNTARLYPGMFAHSSHLPAGVIARFCGPFPRLGSIATSDSRPSSPMRYAAMLSCPRFVPYRNRPSGVTLTSAQ